MPIEIREVVIRAIVDPAAPQGGTADSGNAGGNGDSGLSASLDETVRQVMKILKEKEER